MLNYFMPDFSSFYCGLVNFYLDGGGVDFLVGFEVVYFEVATVEALVV